MVVNIVKEFRKILDESDWMDVDSKKKAFEKVAFMDAKIGYDGKIYNDTYLNQKYLEVI